MKISIEKLLKTIYKNEYRNEYLTALWTLREQYSNNKPYAAALPDEKTAYLITYGDSIHAQHGTTLRCLQRFLREQVGSAITDVHLLPMFPYTSDDGFSVTDYLAINPDLGDWKDIATLSENYRLMFDFVANHISQSSDWFQGYLSGDPTYDKYFIARDPSFDASQVIRPRTSPLFHEYEGNTTTKTAWTTFSKDQVDLNFRHFPVLLATSKILLEYLRRGACSIRLDAIGFIWKESGSGCIHLSEAHAIVKLWRLLAEDYNPGAQIITETNVPHAENISYYGDNDEAHMVYQFALPPLVLHSLSAHNVAKLSNWARNIDRVATNATWFNFLASHDGIGMRPSEGILDDSERQALIDKTIANGGKVSWKANPDGSQTVYELNINYFDALINKDEDITSEQQCQKFIAAQFILLSMIGVPAIYLHSLLGSRNDYVGLEQSGINRRINREKLSFEKLEQELQQDYTRKTVFEALKKLLIIRAQHSAFSPYGSQTVLDCGDSFFCIRRSHGDSAIICLVNVCAGAMPIPENISGIDIVSGAVVKPEALIPGYGCLWLQV